MSNEWVPFYSSLCKGDKRGLARSVRFIYLELSLEARAFDGSIPLPRGFKTDVDAVHDLIGGKRSEIAEALNVLSVPIDPSDPDCEPMISLSGPRERRLLCITSHGKYVSRDKSTMRVRKFREKQSENYQTDTIVGNAFHVTPERDMKRHRQEERREEKRREEDPPVVPQGGTNPAMSPEHESGVRVISEPTSQILRVVDPTEPTKRRSRARASRTLIPSDWQPNEATVESYRSQGVDATACVSEFRNYWLGEGKLKADWEATFRNRVDQLIASGRAPKWTRPTRIPPRKEDQPGFVYEPKLTDFERELRALKPSKAPSDVASREDDFDLDLTTIGKVL